MGPKALGRLAGVALFATSFVAANAGHDLRPVTNNTEIAVSAQETDADFAPASLGSIAKRAQLEFPNVFDGMMGNPSGAIQIMIPSPDGNDRLIWVKPVSRADGAYLGKVTDTTGMAYPKQNDVVLFQTDQVQDWQYIAATGTMYGSFAARDRLAALDASEQAPLRAILSPSVRPTHWF